MQAIVLSTFMSFISYIDEHLVTTKFETQFGRLFFLFHILTVVILYLKGVMELNPFKELKKC